MALHKAPNGSIHDDMGGTAIDLLPFGSVQITDEEAVALRMPTLAQVLKSLSEGYSKDLTELQMAWLIASVSDGPTEASKKEAIAEDIADRKAQYLSDVAAAKSSYS